MSKKQGSLHLLTVDEACSVLACGRPVLSYMMARGELKRLRAPNGELRLSRAEVETIARG